MGERLFSPQWYRVAELMPRLRGHADIHRHVYRGDVWYVLQDNASSRLHRFTPSAYSIIGLLDGERTVQAIWETAGDVLGDAAPTQDDVIALLGQLHRADLLQTDVRPDADEAERRRDKFDKAGVSQRLKNPMALRIPLLDPDRWLNRLQPLACALFNPETATVWFALVLAGLAVAGVNAQGIAAHAAERALTGQNLLLLALVFPFVKILHELGHALAVKRWNGEVHEVGVMLLVFAPMPYVDASGSTAFGNKFQRVAVSAAGIGVELALAAVATIFWAAMEPGVLRDVAFDVMLIGGVSTMLFNGNPLLRFDGYFVLADLIEIPNLAERSRRFLGYLLLRYVFRVADARSPVTAAGEAPWFVVYGIAASVYRVLVAVAIITFVAGRLFIVGVVLATLAAVQMLLVPLFRHIIFIARSPLLGQRRAWALGFSSAVIAAVATAVFLLPVPLATRVEGVVWLPDDARVRADAPGFVRAMHATDGARVHEGQVLFELEDPLRDAQIEVLDARISELEVQKSVEAFSDRVKAGIIEEQIRTVRAQMKRERERAASLEVRSPASGVLVLPEGADPVGRYVRQGDELAVVLDREGLSIRAVVEQPDIALVRERPRAVHVRFADRVDRALPARLVRELPAGHFFLPSRILGSEGGGRIPVEPADEQGLEVKRKVFHVELALHGVAPPADAGQRVHVRFDHGEEPLARQWRRRFAQLFMRGFGV